MSHFLEPHLNMQKHHSSLILARWDCEHKPPAFLADDDLLIPSQWTPHY
jgi:hypothetical protein